MVQKTDLSGAVLDVAGAAICVIDPEGRIVRWNQAAAALTGISANRIRGRVFLETLLLPSDFDDWNREFDRITGGLTPRLFESQWKKHDGSILRVTCSGSVVRDDTGDIRYIVCTVHDSFSRELMADRTEELKEISRFLHNTITQDLIALSFNVSEFEKTAVELIDRCCRDIRVISCMLSPPSLSETTLEESIEMYADYAHRETGLVIAIDLDPVSSTVSPEAQLLFFAAVQSLVVRGIRSPLKPEVAVRLRSCGPATVLDLEIVPGVSIPDLLAGWAIIRERARTLGGEFGITGDSGCVSATLSLPVLANYEDR